MIENIQKEEFFVQYQKETESRAYKYSPALFDFSQSKGNAGGDNLELDTVIMAAIGFVCKRQQEILEAA